VITGRGYLLSEANYYFSNISGATSFSICLKTEEEDMEELS
jgi:hypothetical protein